jgi:hypothetical protein
METPGFHPCSVQSAESLASWAFRHFRMMLRVEVYSNNRAKIGDFKF